MHTHHHVQGHTLRDIKIAIGRLFLSRSHEVHTESWQGSNISMRPEAAMHELMNVSFTVNLESITDFDDVLNNQLKPNQPWCDDHFRERVCGFPINPGIEWENWPWGSSAEKFLDSRGMFNHNYMERYWPRQAGRTGEVSTKTAGDLAAPMGVNRGIRGDYGDLWSLIDLLEDEPHTRQAWLPIFFPEDTGKTNPGRKPCTLGYQFMLREDRLHIYYPLRSCEFRRHFSDDVYLTIRLGLWILGHLKRSNPAQWDHVELGSYSMHCTSLHIFKNDMIDLRNGNW